MVTRMTELKYIKFEPRPKKDGLHDSGFRHIRLIGVDKVGGEIDLGEWHDHLVVEPSCNIDVEPDGTIRIMPWSTTKFYADKDNKWFSSTAWIDATGQFS
jgi:hypothetical protein